MTGAVESKRLRRDDHRLTLKVPQVDESVMEWLNGQHDFSLSLRLLIREEIQRNGYSDTANRPVAQLPRRGRPPVQYSDDRDFDEPTPSSDSISVPVPSSQTHSAPPSLELVSSGRDGGSGVADFLSSSRD